MKLRSVIQAFLLFCLLNCTAASAQEKLTLDLDKAFALVRINNPHFQAKRIDYEIAGAEVQTAGIIDNPMVTSDNGVAEKTYRLGIRQIIPLSRKYQHKVGMTQAQQHAVQADIDTAWLNLRCEVRKAYVHLYIAEWRDKVLQESHRTLEQLLSRSGRHSKKDLMQASLQLVQTDNKIQVSDVEVFQARTILNTLLNRPFNTVWELSPPTGFPESDAGLDGLFQQALLRRPELQRKHFDLETAKEQLKLAKSSRIPDLALTVGPDWLNQPEQRAVSVFVIANIDIPVFNRQQGHIRKHLARQMQVEYEQVSLRENIVMQVANAYAAFKAHKAQATRYESVILPQAKGIASFTQNALGKDDFTLQDVLEAEKAHLDIMLDYLKALQEYQNCITELERAIGTGLR